MAGSWCRRWYEFCTVWANIWPAASSFLERSGRPTPALPRSRDQARRSTHLLSDRPRPRLTNRSALCQCQLARYLYFALLTCQDIHFFNRLIVTPLPPWRYSSLAVAGAYGDGLVGRDWAFPGTRSRINLLPLPSTLPSLPVSPNELAWAWFRSHLVREDREEEEEEEAHSPSLTSAALDGKYHAWRIFSTERFLVILAAPVSAQARDWCLLHFDVE